MEDQRITILPMSHVLFLVLSIFIQVGCSDNAYSSNTTERPESKTVSDLRRPIPSDAIAIIMTSNLSGKRVGYGSVLGDGRLVATAYHIIFESSEIGLHTMSGIVTVISPYLGELCNAKVLIADRVLDLAVLEIPWYGHPSFSLASNNELHDLDYVYLMSYMGGLANDDVPAYSHVQTEKLPIESVLCRRGIPSQIIIHGHGRIRDGWSGCPILSAADGSLIGCFANLRGVLPKTKLSFLPDKSLYNCRQRETASGPAVGLIRKLIIDVNREKSLGKSQFVLKQPIDSTEATRHLLKAFELRSTNDDSLQNATQELEQFLILRPESAIGTLFLASWLEDAGKLQRADETFKRAIELDSIHFHSRIAYGQFLASCGKVDEAMKEFRQAKSYNPNNSLVDCMIAQVISNINTIDNPLDEIDKAIERFPENSRLLAIRGFAYMKKGEQAKAIDSIKKAITFWPENTTYRKILAVTLEKLGRLDEAEINFRDLTLLDSNNPVPYVKLAKFLAKYRPELQEEAIKLARHALALPSHKELDKAKIQEFLNYLNNKSQTQK